MDIAKILRDRTDFNTLLFTMSFPEIVTYIEQNPEKYYDVDWDLFTNSSIRNSKNIDDYPELILKHQDWAWRFNMSQVKTNLSKKLTELNKLTGKSSNNMNVQNNDRWLEKLITSMEKMCELQNRKLMKESEVIVKEIKKEEKVEEQKFCVESIAKNIENQQMPPDYIDNEDPSIDKFEFEKPDVQEELWE